MKNTTNYGLKKPDGTDAVDIAIINQNMDTIDTTMKSNSNQINDLKNNKANASHGNHVPATQSANNKKFLRCDNTWQDVTPGNIGAAVASHTHTKSQISDFPTSFPANGGNADTVDGKHASEFASSTHNHDSAYASKQGVYSDIVSGGIKASDTRNVQYTPEWYMTNKPMSTITEFKTTAAVGITGTGSVHCYLETHTPWNDSSGGYPMQIAWFDTRAPLYRWGINATTWGEWKSLGEGGGDVAGKTYVKATRTVENTGNPNSNLEVINYSNSKGGVCKIAQFGNAKMQIIVDEVMVFDGTGYSDSDSHTFMMGNALSSCYGELPTYPFKNNVKVVDRSSNRGTRVYTAHFYVNS
ncbi:MAG: hypothetical protein E6370_17380 [Clostridiales bacterium]|jgi:hypothetical protein|nr:hypothetical protein [Clostridiales bacterium]MDU6976041.1 hypothetical protein [Clostridiales bacterium]